ncbi:hypothetical protein HOD29_02920 [archaeon]|jgi:hypothetical protein|nr:hypothetical protein [archaeon]
MLPHKHFIYGLIFSGIIYFIFPITILEAGIIFLASFLIDVDHYLYYAYKEKSLNLKKAYAWFRTKGKLFKKFPRRELKKYYTGIYCLHGIEILVILFILGFFLHTLFYFILIGFYFHLILDYIDLIMRKWPHINKVSIIHDYLNSRKLKLIQ